VIKLYATNAKSLEQVISKVVEDFSPEQLDEFAKLVQSARNN
jgi:hypothetical protein